MNIGILGLGRIGLLFAETLLNQQVDIEIFGYAPTKRERYQELINRRNFTFISDWGKFTDLDLDGYVIASPSDTHYDYINQVVFKGKPIFCEKPLDLSLERIERIQRLVDAYHTPLTVGFNRRFDPDIQHLKKQLKEGHVGDPHIIRITGRDPAPPPAEFIRSSGGIFLDQVIHDFDMLRFLLEEDPESIYAEAQVLVDPAIGALGDYDTAVCTLKFPSGCLAVVDSSRKAVYGYDQRIEIFGAQGMLTMQNQRPQNVVLYTKAGSQMHPFKDFFMERYAQSYQVEMQNFIDLCAGKPADIVNVQDAWMATKIANAATISVDQGEKIPI